LTRDRVAIYRFSQMTRVLFVCMGNICRSPTAEGVFRHLIKNNKLDNDIKVDSAGTHGYHVGEPPDPRTQAAAHRRGFDLSRLRARRVQTGDFDVFDLILAMDRSNLHFLTEMCPPEHHRKLGLFLSYARNSPCDEVPDPYYGGRDGFDRVLDLVENAAQGLLDALRCR
jgi:protein-tyrosine phosphatase